MDEDYKAVLLRIKEASYQSPPLYTANMMAACAWVPRIHEHRVFKNWAVCVPSGNRWGRPPKIPDPMGICLHENVIDLEIDLHTSLCIDCGALGYFEPHDGKDYFSGVPA